MFGVTPWYSPRTPLDFPMVTRAFQTPLYFGLAGPDFMPSLTKSKQLQTLQIRRRNMESWNLLDYWLRSKESHLENEL